MLTVRADTVTFASHVVSLSLALLSLSGDTGLDELAELLFSAKRFAVSGQPAFLCGG